MSEEHGPLFEYVPISKMFVDAYGRPLGLSKARKLRSGWDLRAVGVLYLSLRPDGRYAILDGQHRASVARAEGVESLPSLVYLDLTYEDEAKLYIHFATVNQQTGTDKLRAKIEAGDPAALTIKRVVEGQGLRLSLSTNTRGPRTVRASAALEAAFTRYGKETLQESLRLLDMSFDPHPLTFSSALLGGMAAFLIRYQSVFDESRLVRVLKRLGLDQVMIRARAIKQTGITTGMIDSAVGRAILGAYNSGLREDNHLEDWTDRRPQGPKQPQDGSVQRRGAQTVKERAQGGGIQPL